MDPQQAHVWLSTARFEPFLSEASGDHVRAVALYDWHADTAAACFGMVHHFEILFRNTIDGVLGAGQPQHPIKDTWLMDFDILQPEGVKQVIVAVERLDRGKGITRSRVIAGVSFGFWAGLFSNHYEELWRQELRYAFPHGPIVRKDLTQPMRQALSGFYATEISASAASTSASCVFGVIRDQPSDQPIGIHDERRPLHTPKCPSVHRVPILPTAWRATSGLVGRRAARGELTMQAPGPHAIS